MTSRVVGIAMDAATTMPRWYARSALTQKLRVAHAAAYTIGCSQRAMVEKALGAPDERVRELALAWARGFEERFDVTVRASGVDAVDWTKPCIVMANHQSYLDVYALYRSLPRAFGFVAKKSLFSVPAFGGVMRAVGCVPVDRGNRSEAVDSMRAAADQVRTGSPIVIFPEGTRSLGDRVQKLKKGPFYLAQFAGVPIVPVGIRGSASLMPRSNAELRPGTIELVVGEPLPPLVDATSRGRTELANRVRVEIGRLAGVPLVD